MSIFCASYGLPLLEIAEAPEEGDTRPPRFILYLVSRSHTMIRGGRPMESCIRAPWKHTDVLSVDKIVFGEGWTTHRRLARCGAGDSHGRKQMTSGSHSTW